jgi:prephenate dehydrogenase
LAEELKPGTLIFVIGSLLQPAIDSAAKHLPPGAHFVAGHAVITGVGPTPTPRADLFERAVFALTAGVSTDPSALQLASDFVERVGATARFVDAQEHDGIIAGVEQLPALLAAALMRASATGAGWQEARRLAGRHFAAATEVGHDAEGLYAALQANRQNVVLKLGQIRQELAEWQSLLEAEDDPSTAQTESRPTEEEKVNPLRAALKDAVQAREIWETQAVLKNWDEQPSAPAQSVESSGFLRQMFLGGLGNRQRKGK